MIKYDEYQQKAIDTCLNVPKGVNKIFITGAGGTGKSKILKHIKNHYLDKGLNLDLVTPTNLSAGLVNGTTIHSHYKVKPKENYHVEKEEDFQSFNLKDATSEKTNILIVEECSMIGHSFYQSIFSKAEYDLIIMFGDLDQLPPVKDAVFKWNEWADVTCKLFKNYRSTNPMVEEMVTMYRDYDILDIPTFKKSDFTENTYFIAVRNATLSRTQKHILGYTTAKMGDKVRLFAPLEAELKNPNDNKLNSTTCNECKALLTSFKKGWKKCTCKNWCFINSNTGAYATIFSNGEVVEVLGKDNDFKIGHLEKWFIKSNVETKYPMSVIMGDYDEYKKVLSDNFNPAVNFRKALCQKYFGDMYAKVKIGDLKEKMNDLELTEWSNLWSSYFTIKKAPYARHSQFLTTYKAQGQGLTHVVVIEKDIEDKKNMYVALSRAMEKLQTL